MAFVQNTVCRVRFGTNPNRSISLLGARPNPDPTPGVCHDVSNRVSAALTAMLINLHEHRGCEITFDLDHALTLCPRLGLSIGGRNGTNAGRQGYHAMNVAIASVVFAIIMQACASIWWASGINALVKQHDSKIMKLETILDAASSDVAASPAGREVMKAVGNLEGRLTVMQSVLDQMAPRRFPTEEAKHE